MLGVRLYISKKTNGLHGKIPCEAYIKKLSAISSPQVCHAQHPISPQAFDIRPLDIAAIAYPFYNDLEAVSLKPPAVSLFPHHPERAREAMYLSPGFLVMQQ